MGRRRKVVAAVVGLLAVLLGILMWPRAHAPALHEKTEKHKTKAPVHRKVRMEAAPDPDASDAAPMAIPAAPDGDLGPLGTPNDSGGGGAAMVHVQYPDGEPVKEFVLLQSEDCRAWGGGVGPDVLLMSEGSPCTVRAGRPDGRLFAWSDPVNVEIGGKSVAIIPREQTGGLGVSFSRDEDGMVVEQVLPGSPAEQMGLVEGDVILEVDGLSTDALTEDEFISVLTGPVGTEVEFVVGEEVDTGLDVRPLSLVRAKID